MSKQTCIAIVASVAFVSLGSTAGHAQQPAPPQLPQSPNMTFFITSIGPGKGADLGGLEGADRHCQTLAERVGAGGKTWRAYLSTQAVGGAQAVDARDRIGRGPWQNFKGEVIAQNVDDLHSDNNKLTQQTALSERRGAMVAGVDHVPNAHDILTGSQADGRFRQARTGPAATGPAARKAPRWSAIAIAGACATTPHPSHGIRRIPRAGLMVAAARAI